MTGPRRLDGQTDAQFAAYVASHTPEQWEARLVRTADLSDAAARVEEQFPDRPALFVLFEDTATGRVSARAGKATRMRSFGHYPDLASAEAGLVAALRKQD